MYDYVIQLGFDEITQSEIQRLKHYLYENSVFDKERKWLPHITIDLYNCKDEEMFINDINAIMEKVQIINLTFKNINDFDKKTLYIEPYEKNILYEIKKLFDEKLDKYQLEKRKNKIYMPHITLCTNNDVTYSYNLINNIFVEFKGKVKYLWIYNKNMKLIKQYNLGSGGRYENWN